MKLNFLRCLPLSAIALWLCTQATFAQSVTGTITGEVTDQSGAVVSGAHVVATDLDTGVDSPSTTNAAGVFRIQYLPIGHYQVKVDLNGFSTATLPTFSLESMQTANFNVKLAVGSESTTVDVSAAAPILNTTDAVVASTFTANTIRNLPLNGLDFSALTLYVPGSVNTNGVSGMSSIERSTYYTDTPNVNGNRAQANNYTLDGIDLNETFNNLISYSPAPEALAEVKVVTANSAVDAGNVNGAGVFAVLKSGTNQFHGSAYGYVQDYKYNANSWQNNHQTPVIIPKTPYTQSQFGGSFGGPILRDKLFFFVDYLGNRYHAAGVSTPVSVLTAAMRSGDFSALLTGSNPIQLYDPLNNFAPYVGNQNVPIVNPVAKFLFANPKYYPLPNATPSDGIIANNYQGPISSYKVNNQGDIKVEYDLTDRDKVTGFYAMSTASDETTKVLAISFPGLNVYPTWLFGTNWVHTFSPNVVNSAKVGFTRTKWAGGVPIDTTGAFGTKGNSVVGITFPDQTYAGFTNQGFINGGISDVGTTASTGGLIDNTYSYIDTVTWAKGLHSLSFGVQALRYQNNYPTANNNGYLGTLNYTGAFTANPAATNANGYSGADFVLDRVQSAAATLTSVNVGQRQWRAAEYFNDDYKILPNLTLNYGFRYEIDEPWIEENNKTGNIDEATGQVLYANHVPAGAPAGSGICSNRGCYDWNFHQFMPHFGFAYSVNDRFVVRGGYGAVSFFEGNSSNQRLTSITPFIQAVNVSVTSPAPGAITTPRTAEQGFAGGTVSNSGTFNVYPKNIQPAYVQEWNLTLQYALTRATSLQVGYVGESGQHIEDYGNLNQYTVNGDPTSAPYYNNQYIGVNSPVGIGSNNLLVTESRAMMNYNALQAVLRQHFSHGLEFTLNYTYGKAMTNSSGNYALNVSGDTGGASGAFQNYYNSAADYGPAGYDVRHNVSGTGVYALPVGRGQQYFSGANRAVDAVIGGWKLAVAGVSYSGFPETMTGPGNNSNSYGNSRANQYFHPRIVHRSINQWFGTDPTATPCTQQGSTVNSLGTACAFGAPAPNAFGTSSNGAIRGPGYLNVDMSAFKSVALFEGQAIEFRFDAFNALNIASYGNPDTNITDTTFGQIASQGTNAVRSQERHLQFALKYTF